MSTRPTSQYDRPAASGNSELDLGTLTLAAIASAAAAFITSQVWPAGTLWSAAASPVIVALVKEAIRRPATRLQTVRQDRGGRVVEVEQEPPPGEEPDTGPVRIYGRSTVRRRWRLAVVTGLLGFLCVVFVYTVPELVAGRSIGGGGDKRTTLFGGAPSKRHDRQSRRDANGTPVPGTGVTPEPGT